MAPETGLTDKQFEKSIRKIQRGNRDGLREIYEAYLPYVYHIVMEIVHNKENTEDITADFFIKLWDVAEKYQKGNGHRAWLARIAHNMAIDYLRKYKREELKEEIEESQENSSRVEESPEDQVIQDISLKEALAALKETEREVVHLKIMGELTFKEIAEILEIPMGTVTWRYQEAIKKLRGCGYE